KSDDADISHPKGNVVLSEKKVPWIYDGIAQIKDSLGLTPGGQIILYGGEPLDRANRDVVHTVVTEGLARGHFFAAITNGPDLDAYMACLGSGRIEQIQVSIDGPKRVHDKRRVYVGKESSFDAILANSRRVLAETDTQLQVRIHVDPANIELFTETI